MNTNIYLERTIIIRYAGAKIYKFKTFGNTRVPLTLDLCSGLSRRVMSSSLVLGSMLGVETTY